MFDLVGFCGGLVCLGLLAGLGEVVSPLPSRGGLLVISVVFCFLQVFVGFPDAFGSHILRVLFSFWCFWTFLGSCGCASSPACGVRGVFVLCGGFLEYRLAALAVYYVLFIFYICHSKKTKMVVKISILILRTYFLQSYL